MRIVMPLVIDAPGKFVQIQEAIQKQAPSFRARPLETTLLADVVLVLAEAKEFYHCQAYELINETVMRFQYTYLSREQAVVLVETLNNKMGDAIAGINTTAEIGDSTNQIDITINGIIQKIIPELPAFLANHPKRVEKYKFSFETLVETIESMTKPYGFSCDVDAFEETTCRIVALSIKMVPVVHEATAAIKGYPLDVNYILNEYLGAMKVNAGLIAQLDTKKSSANPGRTGLETEIHLSIPLIAAQTIARYFNSITSNSAIAVVEVRKQFLPEKGGECSMVTIKNRVLLDKYFLNEFSSMLESYDTEMLNIYRFRSEYITNELDNAAEKINLLIGTLPECKEGNETFLKIKKTAHDLIEALKVTDVEEELENYIRTIPSQLSLTDSQALEVKSHPEEVRTTLEEMNITAYSYIEQKNWSVLTKLRDDLKQFCRTYRYVIADQNNLDKFDVVRQQLDDSLLIIDAAQVMLNKGKKLSPILSIA